MAHDMVVPKQGTGIQAPALRDVEVNKEASTWISENYEALVQIAKRMARKRYGDVNRVDYEDAVNDVYVKILEKESNGQGFDSERCESPEVFVQAVLSKYLKNPKYVTQNRVVKKSGSTGTITISSYDELEAARGDADNESRFDSDLDSKLAKYASSDDFTLDVYDNMMLEDYVRVVTEYEKKTNYKVRKIVLGEFDIDSKKNQDILRILFKDMPENVARIIGLLSRMDARMLKNEFDKIDKLNALSGDEWILAY